MRRCRRPANPAGTNRREHGRTDLTAALPSRRVRLGSDSAATPGGQLAAGPAARRASACQRRSPPAPLATLRMPGDRARPAAVHRRAPAARPAGVPGPGRPVPPPRRAVAGEVGGAGRHRRPHRTAHLSCAVRKATPCRTSWLATAVALVKPSSARSAIRSGVRPGGADQQLAEQHRLLAGQQSPARSGDRLGADLDRVGERGRRHRRRGAGPGARSPPPAWPGCAPAEKAFRFCGIAELPPTSRSGNRRKPNSAVLHSCRSAASRLRVTAVPAAAASSRSATSRLATASSACRQLPEKPSRPAVRAGSIGRSVPATAPAPSGQCRSPAARLLHRVDVPAERPGHPEQVIAVSDRHAPPGSGCRLGITTDRHAGGPGSSTASSRVAC